MLGIKGTKMYVARTGRNTMIKAIVCITLSFSSENKKSVEKGIKQPSIAENPQLKNTNKPSAY